MLDALDKKIDLARAKRDISNTGTLDWLFAACEVDTLQRLRKDLYETYCTPDNIRFNIKPIFSGKVVDVE